VRRFSIEIFAVERMQNKKPTSPPPVYRPLAEHLGAGPRTLQAKVVVAAKPPSLLQTRTAAIPSAGGRAPATPRSRLPGPISPPAIADWPPAQIKSTLHGVAANVAERAVQQAQVHLVQRRLAAAPLEARRHLPTVPPVFRPSVALGSKVATF